MVYPDTQAPPVQPDHGHGGLINSVYHAIRNHPNPVQMASYAKILASLLADQAKMHAGGFAHAQQTPAGAQTDSGQGAPGQQAGQVIETLTGGQGGGPSYYGQQPVPVGESPNMYTGGQGGVDPIFAALAARHAMPPVADGWAIPRLMGHRGY